MPLNNRAIDSFSHQRKKLKYYAMMLMHTGNNASPFLLRKRLKCKKPMLMHIKRNESLFHLKIKIYLKRIILLHNTNIASHSLLIRKLKLIQKMPLNTKKHQESLSPQQNGQTKIIDVAA
jgi:hypothetical protein